MRHDRLIALADFLDFLSPELLTLDAWVVVTCAQPARPPDLPPGSRACPLGWLPALAPDDWCWLYVQEEDAVYPVYKGSTLWAGETHELCLHQSAAWQLRHRVWRQVCEWFELEDVTGLEQALYGLAGAEPREVADRLRNLSATEA